MKLESQNQAVDDELRISVQTGEERLLQLKESIRAIMDTHNRII
jgi:hypothetical protein